MPEPKSALNDTSGSEREPLSSSRSSFVSGQYPMRLTCPEASQAP